MRLKTLFRALLSGATVALCVAMLPAGVSSAQDDGSDPLVEMVVQLLGDADKDMRALALEQIRTQVPGAEATRKFASLLSDLKPAVQVELISALTDRADAAARPSIVALLEATDDSSVRVAAIRALGFLGTGDDVKRLLNWLSAGNDAESQAARSSLERLPGDSFSQAMAAELTKADPMLRIALLKILVGRRASSVASRLLPLLDDDDPAVRSAAVGALGQLGGPDQIPAMVRAILDAQRGRERDAVEKAVMMVCQRGGQRDQQAAPVLAVMDELNDAERLVVFPTLGRIGGPGALKLVKIALASPDAKFRQAGFQALCNWPDASVAPDLMRLAQTEAHPGDGTQALRSLIRVAPLPDGRTETEKLELLQLAWPLCQRDEERVLILQRASAIRIPETLRFLVKFLEQPQFAQPACQSIVELAHHRALREPHKDEFHEALEQVKQLSDDPVVVDRANRYQKGQTWTRGK